MLASRQTNSWHSGIPCSTLPWGGVAKELLEHMDAGHRLRGKRCPTGLALWHMPCDPRQPIRPRNHRAPFIENFALARAPVDQLEFSGGSTHFLHGSTVSDRSSRGQILQATLYTLICRHILLLKAMIPRLIHQTYKNNDRPAEASENTKALRHIDPDWSYSF